jgi:hypothetical protein
MSIPFCVTLAVACYSERFLFSHLQIEGQKPCHLLPDLQFYDKFIEIHTSLPVFAFLTEDKVLEKSNKR